MIELQAVGDMEQVFFEATSMHTMASCVFNITLRPTVVLRNLLPIPLVCVAGRGLELEIAAGGRAHLPAVEPGQSEITLRVSFCFSSQKSIESIE
jgi:vacuolar protein sorting-associated protein 13A/C